jgi:predicted nucleic acid-binding protein
MRGDKKIIERLKSHAPSELALSAITLAEILYGIEKSGTLQIPVDSFPEISGGVY